MCWKTNWPWHKICCHGWKQTAHTTSLRRELYQSILPPWTGLSRNGMRGRPLTLFGACADYLLLIFRDLHGGHSPAVFSPHRWSCCLPAKIRWFFMYLPTSATEWWIADRSAISGALTPRLAHVVSVLAAMEVWNDTLHRKEGRRKNERKRKDGTHEWKRVKRINDRQKEERSNERGSG